MVFLEYKFTSEVPVECQVNSYCSARTGVVQGPVPAVGGQISMKNAEVAGRGSFLTYTTHTSYILIPGPCSLNPKTA